MKNVIYIIGLFVLLTHSSCKKENELKENKSFIDTMAGNVVIIKETNSTIQRDTTLKAQKVDLLLTHTAQKIDTLVGFCNCEKNIKQNTLKIQIRTEFPSLTELKKGNRRATEFQMGVPRQYRFLTFYLRDSIVEKAKILMASTEAQFDNKKIDSLSIQNYNIKVNTFDYRIAQNVWGTYDVELPGSFNFIENDNKISGTFHCNNWKIVEYENLPEWTIKGEGYIE